MDLGHACGSRVQIIIFLTSETLACISLSMSVLFAYIKLKAQM